MLPNLLVIGAQKAGTSSLHSYLDLHPEISMSTPKELFFFNRPDWAVRRDLQWYEDHFDDRARVRGETSPVYSYYPQIPGVPERMCRVIPDARIIYMVRDPVDRMVSEYLHYAGRGGERRPLEEVFTQDRLELTRYVTRGRYHMQLQRYLEHFPSSRVLVLAQEDLLNDRAGTIRRAFRFLEVDEDFTAPGFSELHNRTRDEYRYRRVRDRLVRVVGPRAAGAVERRAPGVGRLKRALSAGGSSVELDPGLRTALAAHFAEDARRLRALTGERFAGWCV